MKMNTVEHMKLDVNINEAICIKELIELQLQSETNEFKLKHLKTLKEKIDEVINKTPLIF